jgi:hypothetical protein
MMTQNFQRENWVVICGLVRDRQLFNTKLEQLYQWRKEGLISGIVYSTWIGEIDNYEGLRQYLKDSQVVTVETKEPDLILRGHILHQMKVLYYGLQACPEDVYILKMRPDLGNLGNDIYDILSVNNLDLEVDVSGGWPQIFDQRVVILGGSITCPLFIIDTLFYGYKSDIDKLIHFDLQYDVLYPSVGAQERFFIHPFIKEFKILNSYFTISRGIYF